MNKPGIDVVPCTGIYTRPFDGAMLQPSDIVVIHKMSGLDQLLRLMPPIQDPDIVTTKQVDFIDLEPVSEWTITPASITFEVGTFDEQEADDDER